MISSFRTIDVKNDFETCIEFRRDSYLLSFGSLKGLDEEMRSYKDRLKNRIAELPIGNCHLWSEATIIGQVEMRLEEDPTIGYVNLLYLRKALRSQGLGKQLHDRAVEVFSALGKSAIQLSVSRSNTQALRFYAKHGWKNLGPRPGKATVNLMRFRLPDAHI